MTNQLEDLILRVTKAQSAFPTGIIQRLWGGYGVIVRYGLTGSEYGSVIVKQVRLPKGLQNQDGSVSHQRKVRSYQVESTWYGQWSHRCLDACRIPRCLAVAPADDGILIVLEDLDASGFPLRRSLANRDELFSCLRWLAQFHATFMGETPQGLWPTGTYWHLATRPDELVALSDQNLKKAAPAIDRTLSASLYQTLVHGDAKLANFCFAHDGRVAAVDFQYVGGGCGIKDVAYFIDSCLDGDQAEQMSEMLLDHYFQALKIALRDQNKAVDVNGVERDWRALYPVAWTDFHRFLKGWSPGHWSDSSYSERLARQVIAKLNPTN